MFLKGIIEADETYIGGSPRKKNKKSDRDDAPKNPRGRGTRKMAIVGAVERGGKVVASMLERVTGRELVTFITGKVKALKDSTLISDEYTAYKEVGKKIDHKVINHSDQFVDGNTHTNTIEGFWSLLKRAWYGSHHHYKNYKKGYTPLYVAEATYKYNHRKETNVVERFIFRCVPAF